MTHFVPISPSPLQPPATLAQGSKQDAVQALLARDATIRTLVDEISHAAIRFFPQCDQLQLSLDPDTDDGLCIDIFVNQDFDHIKDSAQAFMSWFIQQNRRTDGRLMYMLRYP